MSICPAPLRALTWPVVSLKRPSFARIRHESAMFLTSAAAAFGFWILRLGSVRVLDFGFWICLLQSWLPWNSETLKPLNFFYAASIAAW
jgi:hypothetical protein